MVKIGARVYLKPDNVFVVEGFYDCWEMGFAFEPKPTIGNQDFTSMYATGRDGDTVRVETFDDVVKLHHKWWLRSRDTISGEYPPIEAEWLNDYRRLGLVRQEPATHWVPENTPGA